MQSTLISLGEQINLSAVFRKLWFVAVLLTISSSVHAVTFYGNTQEDWSISDTNPAGAVFTVIDDAFAGSPVLTTEGDATRNAYRVGSTNATAGWNNTTEFQISWALKTTEAFNIYVSTETAEGHRWLRYNHSNNSTLLNSRGTVIHHGLGAISRDGNWHSWSRDLSADLAAAEPTNTLIAVHGVTIRGDVSITRLALSNASVAPTSRVDLSDSIQQIGAAVTLDGSASADSDGAIVQSTWRDAAGETLSDQLVFDHTADTLGIHHYLLDVTDDSGLTAIESVTLETVDANVPTIYSNAENDSLDGWAVRDRWPAGATVARVDDGSGGHAISLQGDGWRNSYLIGHTNPTRGWNNRFQHFAQWRLRADDYFGVFVRVETLTGTLWLRYDSRDTSNLLNSRGTQIHHGIGSSAEDGTWQLFTRDLEADLKAAQPDNTIVAVHGVIVRGNVEIDDLQLMASVAPPLPPPDMPSLLDPAADAVLEAGLEHTFSWQAEPLAQHYDISLSNALTGEVILVENLAAQDVCVEQTCSYDALLDLPEGSDNSWSVKARNESGESDWASRALGVSAAITAAPDAPNLLSPLADANVITGETVTFRWEHAAQATHYDFELLNAADESQNVSLSVLADAVCTDGQCQLLNTVELPAGLVHTWQLKARNRIGSSLWVLQALPVVNPTPDAPTLSTPDADAALTEGTAVTFGWDASTDASTYSLAITEAESGATVFEQNLTPDEACNGTACGLEIQLDFPADARYQWSLIASNGGGNSAAATREFDLVAPEPQAPVQPSLQSPDDGSVLLQGSSQAFQWEADALATHYAFSLATAASSDVLYSNTLAAADICEDTSCVTTLTLSYPADTEYRWSVTALNGTVASDASTREFSLVSPPPPVPTSPALLAPAAGEELIAESDTAFTWAPSTDATHYAFALLTVATNETVFTDTFAVADICDDVNCSSTLTLSYPADTEYRWSVTALNGTVASDASTREFSLVSPPPPVPGTPALLAPAAGEELIAESDTEFTWSPSTDATHYAFALLTVATDENVAASTFAAADICDDVNCSSTLTLSYPADTEYRWSVTALNGTVASDASTREFSLVSPPPPVPTTPALLAPAAGEELIAESDTEFTWSPSTDATHYAFALLTVATDENVAASTFAAADICDDVNCSSTLTMSYPADTEYRWSVTALNGTVASDASTREFNLISPPPPVPGTPALLTPAAGEELIAESETAFTWSPSTDATHYAFALLTVATNETVFTDTFAVADICDDVNCSSTLTLSYPADTEYRWSVTALNGTVASDASTREFSLVSPPPPVPGTPALLAPAADEELIAESDTAFTWSPSTDATHYAFALLTVATNETVFTDTFAVADICDDVNCSSTLTLSYPADTEYQWSVTALNGTVASDGSVREFVLVAPLPPTPAMPTLLTPAADTELNAESDASFSWSLVADATDYRFTLVAIATDDTLVTSAFAASDICDDASCETTLTLGYPSDARYRWSVKALNGSVESDASSREFDLAAPLPPEPDLPYLLLPSNDAAVESGTSTLFAWSPDPNATSFDFQLVDAVTGDVTLTTGLSAAAVCDAEWCTYTTTVDVVDGNGHSWQVRAINAGGISAWSSNGFSVYTPVPSEPQAAFSVSAYAGVIPFTVDVDASDSSDDVGITEYQWAFGDDATQQGSDLVTTSHVFTVPGTYDIALTLLDADGNTGTHTVTVTARDVLATPAEAARFLTQATFGPTIADITAIQQLGYSDWIDTQLALMGPPHLDYVLQHSNGGHRAARHEQWWLDAVDGEDQLRQRVAFALSQLFVVSDVGYTLAVAQYGVTHFYDLLRENAFGNYRELLEDVTLSPIMGLYLSMLQNAKGDMTNNTRADENFAREVMQLFSIGLYNLNLDGTRAEGNAFTQEHVEAFARVFTGWNYKDAGTWDRALHTNQDMINPMEPWEEYHDTDSKTLLNGVVLPAGQSARVDLEMALDNIFAHPNVGPFIATHLIRQLVTSNPSPAYIERVATVFNDNGFGVRGDLGATVKAILTDTEARSPGTTDAFGKVREPVLRLTHLWRAFSVTPGNWSDHGEYGTYSPQLEDLNEVTGQAPLRSPSVFNFYSPDYAPSGPVQDAWLVAPELEIFTDNNILETASRINSQIYRHYKQNTSYSERNPAYIDYETEIALAASPKDLLDHLNLLLLSREVPEGEYRLTDEDRAAYPENLNSILYEHLDAMDSDEEGLIERVQDALAIITSSPDYLVQK